MFSLCTNACATDDERIAHVVPSWLRTFKGRLKELVIVVDRTPPTGRIAEIHRQGNLAKLDRVLNELKQNEPLIRLVELPEAAGLQELLKKWFRGGRPIRCHAGSPVAGMAYSIEQAVGPLIMRCDCDMILHDRGFIDEAERLLRNDCVLIEPPRVGPINYPNLSSRALILHKQQFESKMLPLRAVRIDHLRRLYRWWHGRPTFLALEQVLPAELSRRGLKFRRLNDNLGYSCHIVYRDDFLRPEIAAVIAALESGNAPLAQRAASWDYTPEAWSAADLACEKTATSAGENAISS